MRRSRALALVLALAGAGACTPRARPYRFASPMLGMADVPPVWSGPLGAARPGEPSEVAPRSVRHPDRRDPMPSEDRTSSDGSRVVVHVASAAAADAVPADARSHGVVWSRLRAPHLIARASAADAITGHATPADSIAGDVTKAAAVRSTAAVGHVREPADLRALVGRRITDDPLATALAWSRTLGGHVDPAANGLELLVHADADRRVAPPTDAVAPGDLLVFDRTDGDAPADLVAIAIARDDRHVIEMIYVAGGVVRRGFVDPRRPAVHRDDTGAIVNTFMRAGKRWPPKGTRYLAGELLAHVIHTR